MHEIPAPAQEAHTVKKKAKKRYVEVDDPKISDELEKFRPIDRRYIVTKALQEALQQDWFKYLAEHCEYLSRNGNGKKDRKRDPETLRRRKKDVHAEPVQPAAAPSEFEAMGDADDLDAQIGDYRKLMQ